MAKVKEETALATRPTENALAVADGYDRKDTRGKEGIGSGDVTLPFIALVQKTSKQLEPGEAKFIEGAKFLDLFNSLTNELYGAGPVEFIPLVLKKHAIEFNPFNEGGGIKDRIVDWDDARCQFHGEEKPSATRFYDWAVLLIRPSGELELVVLSFKSTNIGVAKQFQQLVNLRPGPAFSGKYTVKSATGKNNFGTFAKFAISPAGKPTAEQATYAEEIYTNLQGVNIVVNHVADPVDVGGATEGQTVFDPDIPF